MTAFIHTLRQADRRMGIVELCSGKTAWGEDFYAYLNVSPSKYEEYKKAHIIGGAVDLTEYGEVLEAGFGSEPTKQVREQMAKKYNIDRKFEEKIQQQISRLWNDKI